MTEDKKIIVNTDEFIHVKSDTVPDWVKKLDSIKDKIMEKLDNSSKTNDTSNLSPQQD